MRGKRDRIASPDEAAELIAALPEADRAVWATAMYAGLRRGELMALRGRTSTSPPASSGSSAAGTRRRASRPDQEPRRPAPVPIAAVLRDHLVEHKLGSGGTRAGVRPDGARRLDYSASPGVRSGPAPPRRRAGARTERAPALEPITLHECRHTFASLMIAAGVNAKALSTYMGHATSRSPSTATAT